MLKTKLSFQWYQSRDNWSDLFFGPFGIVDIIMKSSEGSRNFRHHF